MKAKTTANGKIDYGNITLQNKSSVIHARGTQRQDCNIDRYEWKLKIHRKVSRHKGDNNSKHMNNMTSS